jgi:ABC-type branched-subunit amino acid transport system ATPase component
MRRAGCLRQDAVARVVVAPGWGRTVVLNGVSLTATPGSTLAVLGRNGAGKTTLFATLMGLTTLHGGMIRMGGRPIDALPKPIAALASGSDTCRRNARFFRR